MKHLLFAFAILVTTCSFSCDEISQDNVCAAANLADLTSQSFSNNFDRQENDTQFFDITNSIINVLRDLAGCEQSEANATAGSNSYLQQIIYSADGTFNDAVVADEIYVNAPALRPNEVVDIIDNIGVTTDGVYDVHYLIDARDEINERNENNNDGQAGLGRNSESTIYVTGLRRVPPRDSNGEPIYIIRNQPLRVVKL